MGSDLSDAKLELVSELLLVDQRRQSGRPALIITRRITRSLRFRLTVGYALFLCVLLIGVGAVYRANLSATLDTQIRDGLEQEWAAIKGYLRIQNDRPIWYVDTDDPDESFAVASSFQNLVSFSA